MVVCVFQNLCNQWHFTLVSLHASQVEAGFMVAYKYIDSLRVKRKTVTRIDLSLSRYSILVYFIRSLSIELWRACGRHITTIKTERALLREMDEE